eukprot:TRINITY_DN3290_c0_g1_i1.p1 TRINITY_DN3290_c0_g1~~TRINITY_DN3290_c0_g1_i1.p1  ORF type:complete len:164 (+),score=14.52 TRINITY_DN3290_c0_g1_i1:112-603(+)
MFRMIRVSFDGTHKTTIAKVVFFQYTDRHLLLATAVGNTKPLWWDGKWHHYVITFDAGENTGSIWEDGVKTREFQWTFTSKVQTMIIGATESNKVPSFLWGGDHEGDSEPLELWTKSLQGRMAEVRFYQYVLREHEVRSLTLENTVFRKFWRWGGLGICTRVN